MPLGVTEEEFLRIAEAAELAGIKLEIIQDLPVWEFLPSVIHNQDLLAICKTIRLADDADSGCACAVVPDVNIRFKDGSLRRPDISIFCQRLPRVRESVTVIPTAVVEIVSPSSVLKDDQISPPFYLSQGVKDVFVYNPEALTVQHVRVDGRKYLRVPVECRTETGCLVGFPQPPEDPPLCS